MNGVDCSRCCHRFLNFVTCGMVGRPAPPLSAAELQVIATVSQGFNGPFPPPGTPHSDMPLTDRHIVQAQLSRERADTLQTAFD